MRWWFSFNAGAITALTYECLEATQCSGIVRLFVVSCLVIFSIGCDCFLERKEQGND